MQRRQRQRRSTRGETRNFAPPSWFPTRQQRAATITTTPELIRSWSTRTANLCLDNKPPALPMGVRSLTAEVADQHPGNWQDVYCEELARIFDEQLVCDITLIAGQDDGPNATVVRAHRCILQARNFELLQDDCTIAKTTASGVSPSLDPTADTIVVGGPFVNQDAKLLHTAVASCYKRAEKTTATTTTTAVPYMVRSIDWRDIMDDLSSIDPTWGPTPPPSPTSSPSSDNMQEDEQQHKFWTVPADVCIVASPGARPVVVVESSNSSNNNNDDDKDQCWSVDGHVAILCAHSEYFRAALTHEGRSLSPAETKVDELTGNTKRILRLDSMQFAQDTVRELVSACYGTSFDICQVPLESILHLIDGATYLSMKAVSMRCEEELATRIDATNVADLIQFAHDNVAQLLLLACHKYLCRNLLAIREAGMLQRLERSQLEAMLRSNFVEVPEDEILDTVLTWAEETGTSFDETKELLRLVRLPFVPIDSPMMLKAVEKNLVTQDMLQICRLFQTDGDYRTAMINSDPEYRPRRSKVMTDQFEATLWVPPTDDFSIMRMLGTVNGRNKFESIRTVQLRSGGGGLICAFPESTKNFDYSTTSSRLVEFEFGNITTPNMSTPNNRPKQHVGRVSLETLQLEDARERLAAMLRREEELRLHPRIQAVYGLIGEDENIMSYFTTALQAHVATEFNVDPEVGIELIRSAASLFPETAKLAHYVRHNRCVAGSLCVGDEAPDVRLSTLEGEPTTLWTEIERRQGVGVENFVKPVLILGASYT